MGRSGEIRLCPGASFCISFQGRKTVHIYLGKSPVVVAALVKDPLHNICGTSSSITQKDVLVYCPVALASLALGKPWGLRIADQQWK